MNQDPNHQILLDEIRALRNDFAEKIKNDASHKESFDALYKEMQQYKENFLHQSERPLLLDLLLFYDSLNWFRTSMVEQEMSPDVLEENFQYLIDEMLELLYRRDVVPMEPTDRFDRTLHKATQVVKTDVDDDHERITQVLKRGFCQGSRVLRPEEVIVARCTSKG